MDVLLALAAKAGVVVSKQELIETVWKQDYVSEDNLAQCIADIRKALDDTDKRMVETIPRVGYRLVPSDRPADAKRKYLWPVALAAIALFALTVGFVTLLRPPAAAKESVVAVLPFDDLSDAGNKGHLSDALSEGIITELARFPQFRVIARNSSFQFRGAPTDIRKIGETLGADYVVEGSQQFDGERLRVTFQLIDSDSGTHVLSEKFDRRIEDLFEMQDQIVGHVVSKIGGSLLAHIPAERSDREVDSLLRALQARNLMRNVSRENWQKALDLGRMSIKEDPESPWGYIGTALQLNTGTFHGWTDQPGDEVLKEAEGLSRKALSIAPKNYMSHYALARVLGTRRDHAESLLHFQRAADLNPSSSMVLMGMSIPLLNIGETERAIEILLKAKSVDPLHGDFLKWQLAWAYWQNHECDKALEAVRAMPLPPDESQTMIAAVYSCVGEPQKAKAAMDIYLSKRPDHTLSIEADRVNRQWKDAAIRKRWLEDMRRSGMPE